MNVVVPCVVCHGNAKRAVPDARGRLVYVCDAHAPGGTPTPVESATVADLRARLAEVERERDAVAASERALVAALHVARDEATTLRAELALAHVAHERQRAALREVRALAARTLDDVLLPLDGDDDDAARDARDALSRAGPAQAALPDPRRCCPRCYDATPDGGPCARHGGA